MHENQGCHQLTLIVLYLQFNDRVPQVENGYICDRSAASKDRFQGLLLLLGVGGRVANP